MRLASPAEIEGWDELVRANPDGGHTLQTRSWGELKRQWGWRPAYLISGSDGGQIATLFLRRPVPGLGWLWYAPKGPGVSTAARLGSLLADRDAFAGAFCVEVEPELPDCDQSRAALAALGLRKSEDVQLARATVVVDLSPPEPEILASFKPKTRYNLRLAARRGVTVSAVPCDQPNIRAMHRLMANAFGRADFPLRTLAYYSAYWRLFEANHQGALFMARLGDEVLAGAYVTWLGEKAWYKDGGSSGRHRELMAPHLLQWEVMRWLRGRGIRSYDLFAVPRPEELRQPGHPSAGLWQFKTGFSSEVREFVGTWDLVLDPRRYGLWKRLAEPVVRRVRWRLRHDLLY
ncbi:MAG TPA: peptidoglycan bridge formation glycyltransferase FemA/FemB family protein [Candidatus Binatia bacterium]|nr:peptidoglycan bridge formation glycyltransferase FemA/FemB family protein [Candidatus Binatia bacterium]